LVRTLLPSVARPLHDDILLAAFDYRQLDPESSVCIRLNSIAIDVRQDGETVTVGYIYAGMADRVAAKHTVLACFHVMIPYLMPELPPFAARGAGIERQDADRIYERGGT
jgi:spermidine dehydrogenase